MPLPEGISPQAKVSVTQGAQKAAVSLKGIAELSGVQSNPDGIPGATAITNIVAISQTDYAALAATDPQTVYVVTPDPAP
jgi:hypothetical protein